MKRFLIQGRFPVPATPLPAEPLVRLPRGFTGYVRVKWQAVAGADVLWASWVPIGGEEYQPQGMSTVNPGNYGSLFADATEKLWEFPPAEMALMVLGSAADGFAIVDAAGEVPEE
jgi:hypothetical protein